MDWSLWIASYLSPIEFSQPQKLADGHVIQFDLGSGYGNLHSALPTHVIRTCACGDICSLHGSVLFLLHYYLRIFPSDHHTRTLSPSTPPSHDLTAGNNPFYNPLSIIHSAFTIEGLSCVPCLPSHHIAHHMCNLIGQFSPCHKSQLTTHSIGRPKR